MMCQNMYFILQVLPKKIFFFSTLSRIYRRCLQKSLKGGEKHMCTKEFNVMKNWNQDLISYDNKRNCKSFFFIIYIYIYI